MTGINPCDLEPLDCEQRSNRWFDTFDGRVGPFCRGLHFQHLLTLRDRDWPCAVLYLSYSLRIARCEKLVCGRENIGGKRSSKCMQDSGECNGAENAPGCLRLAWYESCLWVCVIVQISMLDYAAIV